MLHRVERSEGIVNRQKSHYALRLEYMVTDILMKLVRIFALKSEVEVFHAIGLGPDTLIGAKHGRLRNRRVPGIETSQATCCGLGLR